jgi:hypothetical protein
MDWMLSFWTAVNWMFSGGILYLVYQLGTSTALESGVRWKSWRIVALLLTFAFTTMMFGTGYPDNRVIAEFNEEDKSRFVGIFVIVVATYVLGYVDSKYMKPKQQ